MVVKKFYGATTRDALRQVRDELGPDALILSNRQVPGGGIEIMAVADTDVAALTAVQTVTAGPRPSPPRASVQAEPPQRPATPMSRNLQRTYALPPEDDSDDDAVTPPRGRLNPEPAASDDVQLWRPSLPPQAEAPLRPPAARHELSAAPLRPEPVRQEPIRETPRPPSRPRAAERLAGPIPSLALDAAPRAAEEADATVQLQAEAIEDIARELKFLRGLLEGQLAGIAWGELQKQAPERLEVLRQLLAIGLSPALARHLTDHLPKNIGGEQGLKWAKTALLQNLPLIGPGDELVDQGGVYALVGPTGVGKTTTVAKLAARATLRYGPESVALLTTDSYRIGAHDQLKIYGKILGVPVYAVKDETDLQLTLADLTDRHLVLIDTVGMGQRDKRVAEQVAMLSGEGQPVQRILLMSANAQGPMLDDVVRRYLGDGLAGCIFSKVDEALTIGSGLDVIIRHRLRLHYVTNGQRVPEDLHLANGLYLIDRAFKQGDSANAYKLKDDEYPLTMTSASNDAGISLNLGGRRG